MPTVREVWVADAESAAREVLEAVGGMCATVLRPDDRVDIRTRFDFATIVPLLAFSALTMKVTAVVVRHSRDPKLDLPAR